MFHIGLTSADLISCSVLVQINPIGRQLKLLHPNGLCDALEADSDLDGIPIPIRSNRQ